MPHPDLFSPGEYIDDLGLSRTCKSAHEVVCLTFPSRIHVTPIDCNRFAFGVPGGGGVGFAIEMENYLRLHLCKTDSVDALPQHIPVLEHYVALAKKVFAYDGGIGLECRTADVLTRHSGLGSNVGLACACMQGINVMFGETLSIREIRRLIAKNFVEECEGRLSRGLETGVGTQVILAGGACVVGDRTALLYEGHCLDGLSVVLLFPEAPRPDLDKPESLEMLRRSVFLDESYRYVRAYRIVMELVPAMECGDLARIGDVVWDFQFSGTHLSMIQSCFDGGLEIYRTLIALRAAGVEVVGMSSVGPCVYAIGTDADSAVSTAEELGIAYVATSVAARGVRPISP
jgi:predicted sugar kinase